MKRLRHKSLEVSCQVIFRSIVVIFRIVAAVVMLDQQIGRALVDRLTRQFMAEGWQHRMTITAL